MELVKRGVAKQHIEAGLESVFGEHSERLNVDFQEAEAPDLSALHGGLTECHISCQLLNVCMVSSGLSTQSQASCGFAF